MAKRGTIEALLALFGIDFSKTIKALSGIADLLKKRREYIAQQKTQTRVDFPLGRMYPCIGEDKEQSGSRCGPYFHQDLWVAHRIFKNAPERHADVGSRVDGFVSHVASFRSIEVFDIRPLKEKILNVTFHQADFMNEIDPKWIGVFDSVSSLHVVEHFGLGRYGDPICVDGWKKGIANISSLLRRGGRLYFSVPIGPQRVEFNAHRVFDLGFLISYFKQGFELVEFSYVDDDGHFFPSQSLKEENRVRDNFGCSFGCGIFELIKK